MYCLYPLPQELSLLTFSYKLSDMTHVKLMKHWATQSFRIVMTTPGQYADVIRDVRFCPKTLDLSERLPHNVWYNDDTFVWHM